MKPTLVTAALAGVWARLGQFIASLIHARLTLKPFATELVDAAWGLLFFIVPMILFVLEWSLSSEPRVLESGDSDIRMQRFARNGMRMFAFAFGYITVDTLYAVMVRHP
jgi:hypothetical protein